MAHEIAKQMLQNAGTFPERTEAIRAAIAHGMPLNEIEAYLDWLDATRGILPTGPEAATGPEVAKPTKEA